MRVALVICGDLGTLTGGYLYDRMLVDFLRKRGHRVTVVSLPGTTYGRQLAGGILLLAAARLLRVSCDVMLQDALVHPALFLANRRLQRRCAYPRVALAHMVLSAQPRPPWQNRLLAAVEGAFYRSVDGCIANSRTTLGRLARWGAARRPFLVAPPGGDRLGHIASAGRVQERSAAPGPLRLLFLGNLLPGKGLLPLIDTLARIPGVDWRLAAAGSLTMDGDHVRAVRARIRRRGLGDRIRLTGPVSGPELVRLLEASHLMTMPFSHEGFGMALLEGMAHGLPAIASTRGAARETVACGVNGILVPPERPELAADAVRRLASDRQALARMSLRALDTFHRHPSWEKTLGAVEGFLCRIAER